VRVPTTKSLGVLAVAASLTTLLSACGGQPVAAGGAPTVQLGALLPLTGDNSALGENTSRAVELVAAQVEKAGSPISVELDLQDDGTNESIAQSAVQELLSKNVDAIVGSVPTPVCLAVVDSIVQAETPMIAPGCTSPQLSDYEDGGYFFRTAPPSDIQGEILADQAYADGHRKMAVMAVNNSYGQPIAEAFIAHFEELGGEVATDVKYDAAAKTFSAETQQVANAEPDAVMLIAYYETGAAIVFDAAQRGLLDIPWYAGDGVRDASFPEKAVPSDPTALASWKGTGLGVSDSDAYTAFDEAYQAEYGAAPGAFAPQAYDAAWIAILASALAGQGDGDVQAEIANVTDPDATACFAEDCLDLVAEGEHVSYQGATGAVSFNDAGDPANPLLAIWQFADGGLSTLENVEVSR
jgi:branched-chain amino acid transport system substrate-binding protein